MFQPGLFPVFQTDGNGIFISQKDFFLTERSNMVHIDDKRIMDSEKIIRIQLPCKGMDLTITDFRLIERYDLDLSVQSFKV